MIHALIFACILVLAGELLARVISRVGPIRFPGSVPGGVFALLLGPQVFPFWQEESSRVQSLYRALSEMPSLFITVVFACLMLGKPIRSLGHLWNMARPQIVMGHLYAWGQYVVGIGVTLAVLTPVFDVDPLAGASIAIGFQGGHGTAAGLSQTFQQLNVDGGKTIAYTLATFGILSGTLLGPLLAGALRNKRSGPEEDAPAPAEEETPSESTGEMAEAPLTGVLTLQLAVLFLVILAGWGVLQGLQWLESAVRPATGETLITSYIPLFSVVLMTGFLSQLLFQALGIDSFLHRPLLRRISAMALTW